MFHVTSKVTLEAMEVFWNMGNIKRGSHFVTFLGSADGFQFNFLSLPLANTNYKMALKILIDYFDNQRLVLAIFNLKSLQGESASELRKRIVAFDGNLASMQGLKVDKFSSDFVWSRILTNKLDSNSRRQLGVHHP